jgi:hypothetical protein
MSKVFDTSKDLAKGGVLPLIYTAIKAHSESPDVLQELFAALKVRSPRLFWCTVTKFYLVHNFTKVLALCMSTVYRGPVQLEDWSLVVWECNFVCKN